jgi:hypothetical protein
MTKKKEVTMPVFDPSKYEITVDLGGLDNGEKIFGEPLFEILGIKIQCIAKLWVKVGEKGYLEFRERELGIRWKRKEEKDDD